VTAPLKILLFGKNGQVGWELQRALAPLGHVLALGTSGQPGLAGDFRDSEAIARTVRTVAPDVIVNAAAYTAVDKAEGEPELARSINADSVAAIAREAAALGAWLVHYSTDYVFDGSGERPWCERDVPAPLSVYGQTKLAGEQAIQAAGCRHLIFRTSWVYATRGGNFIKTMLRLAAERDQLKVIDDQFGAPTGAELIADVTAHAIRTARRQADVAGLYHLAAAGETTWYGYARHVIESARAAGRPVLVRPEAVQPVPTSAYPLPAPRPHNSRLDTALLQQTFDLALPHWKIGVSRTLAELFDK